MEWVPVPGFKAMEAPDINESSDYILLLYFDRERDIDVGALGKLELKKGTYAYCGSAKAGLWGRVKRHLSDPVRKRWHIDHITQFSTCRKIFWKEHEEDGECRAANTLYGLYDRVNGFGCSDCRCRSHLYYLGEQDLTSK